MDVTPVTVALCAHVRSHYLLMSARNDLSAVYCRGFPDWKVSAHGSIRWFLVTTNMAAIMVSSAVVTQVSHVPE